MSEESTIRTFRLDAEVIRGLEEEASRQGATVNGIACRILRRYVKIRAKLDPFGILFMTRTAMMEIIGALDDDGIEKVAGRLGGTLAKEMVAQIYGEPSSANFFTFLDQTLCGFMGWATYTEEMKDKYREVRLGHTMGEKWSTFLRSYLDSAAKSITGTRLDFRYVSNYSIIVHIPK